FDQYIKFWGNILRGDLGPSFSSFPTPVMDLIRNSLPWTVGLLLVTTVLSWVIGNILGGIVGCNRNKRWAKGLEVTINALRPIPYYIMALLLLIVFSYILPLFPSGGAYPIGTVPRRDWSFFADVLKHAFLPGLSLLLVGIGGWFQGMRTLVSHIMGEDYVVYAKLANLNKKDVFSNYIMRNAMLPQITGLALQLGMIFSGTLITEIVFNYPGLGLLSYNAILRSDYNLIMGVTILSIVAVSFGTLIIDLIYPLLDPRIAY
ncbi:MAG: ABC transporter permease, partial [Atribacterales bacterium]